ncbi:MAG: tRNA (adenosine(37)-N6)-dimethylallyltransferase MiaA [Gammaproteobacteria bacterium]|nr:tRNA (adenosine(37)-N6)-dimethylallyltransferase MiaA [Gammaproteobacteria bacterium]
MPHEDRPLVFFLAGPTTTGKTDLAVEIARRFPCDIVSVDSAMVFRGMDIGTAKPDQALLRSVPHRLIDICDPLESYSAARFRVDALREIREIHGRGRIPLLVGGTMLYFEALERGLSRLPGADAATRRRLEQEALELGWETLHARLSRLDPAAARRIHPNDPQRIQRALEVHALTGRSMSELMAERDAEPFVYRAVKLHVEVSDRAQLHERIRHRFHDMLARGLEGEVEILYRRGDLHPGLPAIRAVGYRQLWRYLAGEQDRETSIDQAITATRQLAKRQMTWLRSENSDAGFDSSDPKIREKVLNYIGAAAY